MRQFNYDMHFNIKSHAFKTDSNRIAAMYKKVDIEHFNKIPTTKYDFLICFTGKYYRCIVTFYLNILEIDSIVC